MTNDTLIFDLGESILGIYSVKWRKYVAYWNDRFEKGVHRLVHAREIVSYNGNRYDLPEIGRRLGLPDGESPKLMGVHVDMREMCWGDILGSCLPDTYIKHLCKPLRCDGTYEGNNKCDVQMTYKLWRCWKKGTLKIADKAAPTATSRCA